MRTAAIATAMLLISTLAFASLVQSSVEVLTESCTFQLIPPLGKACEVKTCVAECRKLQGDQQHRKCSPGNECITGDGVCIAEGCDCMVCNHGNAEAAVLSSASEAPAN